MYLYYFSCTQAIKPFFLFFYFIRASLSEKVVAMHILKMQKLHFCNNSHLINIYFDKTANYCVNDHAVSL